MHVDSIDSLDHYDRSHGCDTHQRQLLDGRLVFIQDGRGRETQKEYWDDLYYDLLERHAHDREDGARVVIVAIEQLGLISIGETISTQLRQLYAVDHNQRDGSQPDCESDDHDENASIADRGWTGVSLESVMGVYKSAGRSGWALAGLRTGAKLLWVQVILNRTSAMALICFVVLQFRIELWGSK